MRSLTVLVALAATLAACTGPEGPASPPSAGSFGLRAWTTQALPPDASFATGPVLTISDGSAITIGAVPAIYPGPLVVPLIARSISDDGAARILADMRAAGLLGDRTDFSDRMLPGAALGHIRVTIDGVSREIIGDPSMVMQCIAPPCMPPAGTPEAFATIWNRFYDLGTWLGSALGPEQPYVPDRAAILVTQPTIDPGFPGQVLDWPLDEAFATVGVPFPGLAGTRCLVADGEALDALRPMLQEANQLTRFRDSTGLERRLVVRPLVPGEPDPCTPQDEAAATHRALTTG